MKCASTKCANKKSEIVTKATEEQIVTEVIEKDRKIDGGRKEEVRLSHKKRAFSTNTRKVH